MGTDVLNKEPSEPCPHQIPWLYSALQGVELLNELDHLTSHVVKHTLWSYFMTELAGFINRRDEDLRSLIRSHSATCSAVTAVQPSSVICCRENALC